MTTKVTTSPRRPRLPVAKAVSQAARAMSAQRKTHAGGAPSVLAPCQHCGTQLGARLRRAHEPKCPKNPKNSAAVQR